MSYFSVVLGDSVSRNVATVLLEGVFDNYLWELGDDLPQIVARQHVSQVTSLLQLKC